MIEPNFNDEHNQSVIVITDKSELSKYHFENLFDFVYLIFQINFY